MSKIKVSDKLVNVLKNFSSINKSIVIEPGNVVSTLSVNKNILAKAEVVEEFPNQIAIYDLGVFLGGVSLFDDPVFDCTDDKFIKVSNKSGRSKSVFYYADPDVIVKPPQKEIELPSEDVQFALKASDLQALIRASSIYQVPDLCVYAVDGEMNVCVKDKRNDTSNMYNVTVGESSSEFCYCFKVENLRMIPGDYDVTISNSNVALFKNETDKVKYWIALEP
ncbi:gp45 [Synechococcus phage S-CBM2]|nr:gp45 [Synechococcus phage S-CBM2]